MALKSKKIKGFRKGLGYERYEEGTCRDASVAIDAETGQITLPASVVTTSVAIEENNGRMVECGGYVHIVGINSTGKVEIWRSQDGETWTKTYTSTYTPGGYQQEIYGTPDSVVMFHWDSATGSVTMSADSGNTWTHIGAPGPLGLVYSGLIIGEHVYLGAQWNSLPSIVRTRDGINFEVVYAFGDGDEVRVFTLAEQIYCEFAKTIYRIRPDGIAERITTLSRLGSAYVIDRDALYFFVQAETNAPCRVYVFDGETRYERLLNLGGRIFPIQAVDGFVFFVRNTTGTIMGMDYVYAYDIETKAVYYIEPYPTVTGARAYDNAPFIFNGQRLYTAEYYAGGSIISGSIRVTKSKNFMTAGTLETGEIDLATHLPKRLVLRHDPLPVGTSVKVYVRFDRGSAYTLILTSSTASAIKAVYDWEKGTGPYEFVEFKIVLETTDSDVSPSGVDLEYLYYPNTLLK